MSALDLRFAGEIRPMLELAEQRDWLLDGKVFDQEAVAEIERKLRQFSWSFSKAKGRKHLMVAGFQGTSEEMARTGA